MKPGSLLPVRAARVAFWLLVIRPSQRAARGQGGDHVVLGPGAEVVTSGGIHGTVTALDDDVVELEIADGVQVRFARSAIARGQGHRRRRQTTTWTDDADPSDTSDPSEPTT